MQKFSSDSVEEFFKSSFKRNCGGTFGCTAERTLWGISVESPGGVLKGILGRIPGKCWSFFFFFWVNTWRSFGVTFWRKSHINNWKNYRRKIWRYFQRSCLRCLWKKCYWNLNYLPKGIPEENSGGIPRAILKKCWRSFWITSWRNSRSHS